MSYMYTQTSNCDVVIMTGFTQGHVWTSVGKMIANGLLADTVDATDGRLTFASASKAPVSAVDCMLANRDPIADEIGLVRDVNTVVGLVNRLSEAML